MYSLPDVDTFFWRGQAVAKLGFKLTLLAVGSPSNATLSLDMFVDALLEESAATLQSLAHATLK